MGSEMCIRDSVMISLPTAEEREGEEEEGEFVLTKEGKDFSFFF